MITTKSADSIHLKIDTPTPLLPTKLLLILSLTQKLQGLIHWHPKYHAITLSSSTLHICWLKEKDQEHSLVWTTTKKISWCILITLLDLFLKLLTCFEFLIIRCTWSIKSYSTTWASVGSRSRHNRQKRVYHWKYQVSLILSAITTLIALFFTFYLLCRGDELRITLWGDVAKSFDDSILHEHTNPIIVVFAGFRVTEFKGLYY